MRKVVLVALLGGDAMIVESGRRGLGRTEAEAMLQRASG